MRPCRLCVGEVSGERTGARDMVTKNVAALVQPRVIRCKPSRVAEAPLSSHVRARDLVQVRAIVGSSALFSALTMRVLSPVNLCTGLCIVLHTYLSWHGYLPAYFAE